MGALQSNLQGWEEKGLVDMEFQGGSGETKSHNVMCRPSAIAALRRIHVITAVIASTKLSDMLKQRLDLKCLFCLCTLSEFPGPLHSLRTGLTGQVGFGGKVAGAARWR